MALALPESFAGMRGTSHHPVLGFLVTTAELDTTKSQTR